MTSPLPRTTTSGTRSGRPTSASAPAWPGVGTSCTASAGTPLAASAGAITCSTSACALPSAAAPVRRTAALRALSTCDATSTVTLGRASNTAPITPTGTRRSYTRSPVGRSRTNTCSGGSGVAARTSSWVAMSARRSGVRRRRSSRPWRHAARLGGLDVGAVGGEQRLGPLAQEPGGGAQGGVDRRAARGPDARRGRGGAEGGLADGGLLGGVRVDDGGAHGLSLPRRGRTEPRHRARTPPRRGVRSRTGAAAPARSTSAICEVRHPAAATGDETGLT